MLDENKAWLDLDVEKMSQIKTILVLNHLTLRMTNLVDQRTLTLVFFLNNLSLTHLLMMKISLTILILSKQTELTSLSILYENNKY